MNDDEVRHLAADVLRAYLSEAIRRGRVDPRGRTDAELVQEIRRLVDADPSTLHWLSRVDHRPMLLAEARRCLKSKCHELACLLYATWTEHWVNLIIDLHCVTAEIADTDRREILRGVTLAGKCTWLLRLLGQAPLPEVHTSRIRIIAEHRNSFVHYKWPIFTLDDPRVSGGDEHRRFCDAVSAFEKTIKYLQAYEAKRIMKRASDRVRSFTDEIRPDTPANTYQPSPRQAPRSSPSGHRVKKTRARKK